jgi:branched-chain amino acid transport system ATP-binding protein
MPTSTDSRRPDTGYLVVQGLTAGYGAAPIINDISLTVAKGEVVTVIGPNGGGKSTMLKCLTGRLRPQAGRVLLDGGDVTAASGNALTKGGLGYVPQHNDIFPTLTVRENLEMGGYLLPKAQVGARIEEVLDIFPTLRPLLKRSGKLLSGGERKLLGIGRSLISSPKLLILDEPTAGLSPILARSMLDDHITSLARAGVTILLVEQRARQAMQIADWCYVLVAGRVELNDAPAALLARTDFGELFLGRSARTPPPAAPDRHLPQATTGQAATAADPYQGSHRAADVGHRSGESGGSQYEELPYYR